MSLCDWRGRSHSDAAHSTSGSGRRSLTESHFVPTGKPLSADQDPGRLLLLCVRAARGQGRPRPLLRGDGAGHDRGHLVSVWLQWKRLRAVGVKAAFPFDCLAMFSPYRIKTLSKLCLFITPLCTSTHPSIIRPWFYFFLSQLHPHLKGRLIQNENDPSFLPSAMSLETQGVFANPRNLLDHLVKELHLMAAVHQMWKQ